MIVDLTDLDVGIDADGLDAEDLERPVAGKAHVAETSGDMDEQTQATGRRTTLEHGDKAVGAGELVGASEVQTAGFKHQTFFGNGQMAGRVGGLHVENVVLVDQKLICQGQVVAVGVQAAGIVRLNDDLLAEVFFDFLAG